MSSLLANLLDHLREVCIQKKLWTEITGDEKLPNERMDQLLKDNPIDEVFDFEEQPNVKFRSYVESKENGNVLFAQIDSRLANLFLLEPPCKQVVIESIQKLQKS